MNRIMKKIFWLILFFTPFGLYCFKFPIPLSSNKEDWSVFGSYMGGIYGSLAFIVLAYTTWITQKQFRIQNEDNTFFKLHETLQNRIENSSIKIDSNIINGHSTPEFLVKDFFTKLTVASRKIARNVLCKTPEMIIDASYIRIFEASSGLNAFSNFDQNKINLISEIKKRDSFNDKWEFIKYLIGTQDSETPKVAAALESTGSVLFYKISFDDRRFYYQSVLGEMLREHGAFLDVYFKNLCFLLVYVDTCLEKEIYYRYIKSQLSKYELIMLFYFIVGSKKIEKTHTLINQFLLNENFNLDCRVLMIDLPYSIQIKSDLHDALN